MVDMRSTGALQPHQPKPVEVETVVPNRTRPKLVAGQEEGEDKSTG